MSGSLTTAETVVRRVQRDFGDSAETQITIDDIFDWINFGQLEIVRQTECLEGDVTFVFDANGNASGGSGTVEISGGISRLVLPDNFLYEQRLTYGTFDLTRVQFQDVVSTQYQVSTDPNSYYIRSGRINMVPAPTPKNLTITLSYVIKPTEVHAMADVIDIPSSFTLDLVEYCTMKAKELAEDYQHANIIGGRLINRLANSKNEANVPSDSYAVVRDDANDYW